MANKVWEKIKEINRFSFLPKDYKTNNKIFQVAIGLIGLWLVIAGFNLSEVGYYYHCQGRESPLGLGLIGCDNPFYMVNCERLSPEDQWVCMEETLPAGFVMGEKPGFFYENAGSFAWLVMILAVVINHLIYNRKYKPGLEELK